MIRRIFYLLLFLPGMASAQFAGFTLKSNNQQLIEDAIGRSCFVITQDYQLKDSATNEYFGRGGQNEFGRTYSLAVKVEGGYCYLDEAERPWQYDDNFHRYRATHLPVIYKTQFKELPGNALREASGFYSTPSVELLPKQVYFKADSTAFNADGFAVDSTAGHKKSWIVWLTVNASTNYQSIDSVSYIIYRKDLDVKKEVPAYDVSQPSSNQKILGGILVEPVQEGVGKLTFRLVGLVAEKSGKWSLLTPFVGTQVAAAAPPDATTVSDSNAPTDELTPVAKDEERNTPQEATDKKKKKSKKEKE